MKEVMALRLNSGQLEVAFTSASLGTGPFRLAARVSEKLVYQTDIDPHAGSFMLPLPLSDMLEAPVMATLVTLYRGSQTCAEAVFELSRSDRQARPIVVVDKRPTGMRLNGWVVPSQEQAPRLTLFVDGHHITEVEPTRIRKDIVKLFPETAQIRNGFGVVIPEEFYDGQPHSFVILEENSGVIADNCALILSPKDLRGALLQRSKTLFARLEDLL